MPQTVALYLRVSTVRQAEKDLSIPDQRRQATAYCAAKGWSVVAEYEEAGASATDDRRPAFQRMIGDACGSAHPFDTVVVHSFSRFFRDAFQSQLYIRARSPWCGASSTSTAMVMAVAGRWTGLTTW
jgi:site-specific DNA recombinase